jgi:hypothetical protein
MNYDSKQPISNNIRHKPLFIIIGKLPTSRQCKKLSNDESPQLKNALYCMYYYDQSLKSLLETITQSNNIYIPILLCLTSLSLPDMIGQFSKNPGKKQPQRFLVVSEMSRF